MQRGWRIRMPTFVSFTGVSKWQYICRAEERKPPNLVHDGLSSLPGSTLFQLGNTVTGERSDISIAG